MLASLLSHLLCGGFAQFRETILLPSAVVIDCVTILFKYKPIPCLVETIKAQVNILCALYVHIYHSAYIKDVTH